MFHNVPITLHIVNAKLPSKDLVLVYGDKKTEHCLLMLIYILKSLSSSFF